MRLKFYNADGESLFDDCKIEEIKIYPSKYLLRVWISKKELKRDKVHIKYQEIEKKKTK
jgi:hypothetical protein